MTQAKYNGSSTDLIELILTGDGALTDRYSARLTLLLQRRSRCVLSVPLASDSHIALGL